jgi:hypothetical protein
MKSIRLSVGQKIMLANLLLLFLFSINAVVSIRNINEGSEIIIYSSEVAEPSINTIEDFKALIANSKTYITNWVYLPQNNADKESMKRILALGFPSLKDRISALKRKWLKSSHAAEIDSVIIRFDELLRAEQKIMLTLATDDDYNDFSKKVYAEDIINRQVLPISHALLDRLEFLLKEKNEENVKIKEEFDNFTFRLKSAIVLFGIGLFLFGITFSYLSVRYITKPIKEINKLMWKLSRGRIPELTKDRIAVSQNDEIADMEKAIRKVILGLKSTTMFAQKIGEGNYKYAFNPLSEEDELGNALLTMRKNLASIAEETEARNWINRSLAKFADVLRKNYDDLDSFYYEVLANMVQILNANQGALFIIGDDTDNGEPYMTAVACYAWDKHKLIDKKIYKGEGLAGQAWQERDTIYLSDIPENYIEIGSGLGKKKPKNILIVPAVANDEIYGVVEVASFQSFSINHKEFLEKICANFATTLSTVKMNDRTKLLLADSTRLASQMKEKEEVLYESIEKMRVAQESIQRKNIELEAVKRNLESELSDSQIREQQLKLQLEEMYNLQREAADKQEMRQREVESLVMDYEAKIAEIEERAHQFDTIKENLEEQSKLNSQLVEIVGRNSVISQKIAFYCEMVARGEIRNIDKLRKMIDSYNEYLSILKRGGLPPEIENAVYISPPTETALQAIEDIESVWASYLRYIDVIIDYSQKDTANKKIKLKTSLEGIEEVSEKLLMLHHLLIKEIVKNTKVL